MISQLANDKVSVLFSSHSMEEVARIADRLILIHSGKIAAQGKPEDLLNQYQVENLEDLYMKLTDIE